MSINEEERHLVTAEAPKTAREMKAHIQAIQEVVKAVMVENTHYGTIPGTDKAMLYKAGAEVLLTTFHISAQPEIEDLSKADEIRYRISVRGIHMGTGVIVGVGIGECSTNEEKYKWRGCGDKEYENTVEDRKRIKYGWKWGQKRGEKIETEVKQVRTEPADLANTVLKMANKRAKSDLCLTSLAASDVFVQEIEDVIEHFEGQVATGNKTQSKAPKKKQAAAKEAEGEPQTGLANAKQLQLVKVKCDQAGIREVDFLAQFSLRDWEQLPFEKVNAALEWIKENSP
jgi:hypothetical protein